MWHVEESAAVGGMTHRGNDRGCITLHLCAHQLGRACTQDISQICTEPRAKAIRLGMGKFSVKLVGWEHCQQFR